MSSSHYIFGLREECPYLGRAVIFSFEKEEICLANDRENLRQLFQEMGIVVSEKVNKSSVEINEIVAQVAGEDQLDLFVCVLLSNSKEDSNPIFHCSDGVPMNFDTDVINILEASEAFKDTVKIYLLSYNTEVKRQINNGHGNRIVDESSQSKKQSPTTDLTSHEKVIFNMQSSEGFTDIDSDGIFDLHFNPSIPLKVDLSNTLKLTILPSENDVFNSSFIFSEFIEEMHENHQNSNIIDLISNINNTMASKAAGKCGTIPLIQTEQYDLSCFVLLILQVNKDMMDWLQDAVKIATMDENSILLNYVPHIAMRMFSLGAINLPRFLCNIEDLIENVEILCYFDEHQHMEPMPNEHMDIIMQILSGHVIVPSLFGAQFVAGVTTAIAASVNKNSLIEMHNPANHIGYDGSGDSVRNNIINHSETIELEFSRVAKYAEHVDEPVMLKCREVNGVITIDQEIHKAAIYYGQKIREGSEWQKHGIGFLRRANDSVYDGDWKNNMRHGHGYFRDSAAGTYYIGEWQNDHMCGYGRFVTPTLTYVGDFKESLMCGQGILVAANGDESSGSFKDNLLHGEGKFVHKATGDIYSGYFEKGELNGLGTVEYKSGHIYEGEFANGEWCGQGKLTKSDGTIIEGTYKHNKMNGHGTYKDINGSYIGMFVNDTLCGEGTFNYSSGDSYTGNFLNNEPSGFGTSTKQNGDTYTGDFLNGDYHGQGQFISKEFQLQGTWVEGRFEGWGSYLSGDMHYEGNWKSNVKHGYGESINLITNETQTGEWKNGDFVFGKWIFPSEKVYFGGVKNDNFHGFGSLKFENGDCYIGNWVSGSLKDVVKGATIDRLFKWKSFGWYL